jgi:hypothetical protein
MWTLRIFDAGSPFRLRKFHKFESKIEKDTPGSCAEWIYLIKSEIPSHWYVTLKVQWVPRLIFHCPNKYLQFKKNNTSLYTVQQRRRKENVYFYCHRTPGQCSIKRQKLRKIRKTVSNIVTESLQIAIISLIDEYGIVVSN